LLDRSRDDYSKKKIAKLRGNAQSKLFFLLFLWQTQLDWFTPMQNLDRYYKILGLEPSASLEEVNQAHKDLVFVWHPDRIPKDNDRLLQKSQEKIKEINDARDVLRSLQKQNSNFSRQSSKPQTQNTTTPPKPSYRPPTPPPAQPPNYNYQPYDRQSTPKRPHYRDLTGADLQGANLKEKDLSGVNLQEADLSYADLSDSFLHKVILEGANLHKANLFRANLLGANLRQANLREANLIGADLSGADLSGADLSGAKIGVGNKVMVKLTGVKLTGTILPDGTIHG
jgi:curved DNA-binding protein CbpA